MQSIAYLPEEDIEKGFKYLVKKSPPEFEPITQYFLENYVGTKSKKARFPIPTWNLNKRVMNNLPRTNNSVESWHNVIQDKHKQHLSVSKLCNLV